MVRGSSNLNLPFQTLLKRTLLSLKPMLRSRSPHNQFPIQSAPNLLPTRPFLPFHDLIDKATHFTTFSTNNMIPIHPSLCDYINESLPW